jgi:hypothetical protein
MKEPKATKDMSDDDLATQIMNAMCDRDLTHDEVIAIGDSPYHAAMVRKRVDCSSRRDDHCPLRSGRMCLNIQQRREHRHAEFSKGTYPDRDRTIGRHLKPLIVPG